ncbi:hypothetical protein [Chamaesiphon polymorphus]|uniref:hypothetical protein n=1 Tax=Chamaesiphon polymorphus TaxID=2107691 RepID=UPI0015E6C50E|nr:hypothetical protein [Chamaesiphon polymorphus]
MFHNSPLVSVVNDYEPARFCVEASSSKSWQSAINYQLSIINYQLSIINYQLD